MQVFFQGQSHPRHQVLPFVTADNQGNWGLWYSDDRKGCSLGPYFGRRPNDPLACWRGLQLLDAFLESSTHFSPDVVRAAWDLGFDPKAAGPAVDQIRATLSGRIEEILQQPVPSMDEILIYAVENDQQVSMSGIYDALKQNKMQITEILQGCCNASLLLVHGDLVPQYMAGLAAVRGGRSGGAEKIVRDYIDRADAMFRQHLPALEQSFNKINRMLPGTEAATAMVKTDTSLLQTITARFRRSDVMAAAAGNQVSDIRKEIGMDRIACGETITAIHQNFTNQHPYADMKLPNYHKSLKRLAQSLLSFSDKLADFAAVHNIADDVRRQADDCRRNLDDLRIWLNLTVLEEMPGIYVLNLKPGR